MKYAAFLIKYLAIGILLGVGIVLVDELHFKYGTPARVEIMGEFADEINDGHSKLIEVFGAADFPLVKLNVFGQTVQLEESCQLFLEEWPALYCEDYPHISSIRLSQSRETQNDEILSLERIAVDGTFSEHIVGKFKVVSWLTDMNKLNEVFNEGRTEPVPQPEGTLLPMEHDLPSYSAKVCFEMECVTITSGSKNKIEGIIAQITAK